MHYAAHGIQNLLLTAEERRQLSPELSKPQSLVNDSSDSSRGESRSDRGKLDLYKKCPSEDQIVLSESKPEALLAKDIKLPLGMTRTRSNRGFTRAGYRLGLASVKEIGHIRKGSSSDDKFTTLAETQRSPILTERPSFHNVETHKLFSITEPKFNSTIFSGKMSNRPRNRQHKDQREPSPPESIPRASRLRSLLASRKSSTSMRLQLPTSAIASLCRAADSMSAKQSMILTLDSMRTSRQPSVDQGSVGQGRLSNTQMLRQLVNRQPNPQVRSRVIQNNPLLRAKR